VATDCFRQRQAEGLIQAVPVSRDFHPLSGRRSEETECVGVATSDAMAAFHPLKPPETWNFKENREKQVRNNKEEIEATGKAIMEDPRSPKAEHTYEQTWRLPDRKETSEINFNSSGSVLLKCAWLLLLSLVGKPLCGYCAGHRMPVRHEGHFRALEVCDETPVNLAAQPYPTGTNDFSPRLQAMVASDLTAPSAGDFECAQCGEMFSGSNMRSPCATACSRHIHHSCLQEHLNQCQHCRDETAKIPDVDHAFSEECVRGERMSLLMQKLKKAGLISPLDEVPVASGAGHRAAVSYLRGQSLEGVPIAVKLSAGKFRYLNEHGASLGKAEAMRMADGVIYYQDEGRLRRQGTFISVDEAHRVLVNMGAVVARMAPHVYGEVN
jgi:hypothetical protein